MLIKKKFLFYLLSWTWGLPTTIVGAVVWAALRITGHKDEQFGWCRLIRIGRGWGGVSFGPFILVSETMKCEDCAHEHGHSHQNAILGPFMIFLVNIPSVCRYWYFRIRSHFDKTFTYVYDAVWFEGGATINGVAFICWLMAREAAQREYNNLIEKLEGKKQ